MRQWLFLDLKNLSWTIRDVDDNILAGETEQVARMHIVTGRVGEANAALDEVTGDLVEVYWKFK